MENKKITLVIMAAGIGARFGVGIKQLQKIEGGNILMDYSVHDAVKAGFNKIVFILRRAIEAEFKEVIGERIEKICAVKNVEVCYVFQDDFNRCEGRSKPWGTGHAILSCKDVIFEPFAVINADDYYGKQAYCDMHDHLKNSANNGIFCLEGFTLKNTLSENGSVKRGLCSVSAEGYLESIEETGNIVKTERGVFAGEKQIDEDTCVSMNMWGFSPDIFAMLNKGFCEFLEKLPFGDNSEEFLIPVYIGKLLREGAIKVKVYQSPDKWLGMTYKEDVASVVKAFGEMINEGRYLQELYKDL